MGWFTKKADPLSERAQALTDEIAALEAQIKQLDSKLTSPSPSPSPSSAPAPRLRSTAMPHGTTTLAHPPQTAPVEPIFEEVNQNRLKSRDAAPLPPEHFNDLGVRKYDLAGFLRRLQNHFRAPP